MQRPGTRPGTFVESFGRGEDRGFDAIVGLILDVAKPTKVQLAFRPVPQMATAFKSELHQKGLQSALVRRVGMQRDFYAHGLGSWSSRAKLRNEKPRRGWNIHRIRLGREASPGIADIFMNRAAVNASDAPDSESGGGLPRRPDRLPPCVPAAKPGRSPSAVSRLIATA